MTKIVYNACFGGFSVSDAGMRRYAEIKGITLYPELSEKFGELLGPTYWTVPPEERSGILSTEEFMLAPMEARAASNKKYSESVLSIRDFDRSDPALVQVVEELGEAASGRCAKLKVAEVPAGTPYRIDEYDGSERVMTIADYEWSTA